MTSSIEKRTYNHTVDNVNDTSQRDIISVTPSFKSILDDSVIKVTTILIIIKKRTYHISL